MILSKKHYYTGTLVLAINVSLIISFLTDSNLRNPIELLIPMSFSFFLTVIPIIISIFFNNKLKKIFGYGIPVLLLLFAFYCLIIDIYETYSSVYDSLHLGQFFALCISSMAVIFALFFSIAEYLDKIYFFKGNLDLKFKKFYICFPILFVIIIMIFSYIIFTF